MRSPCYMRLSAVMRVSVPFTPLHICALLHVVVLYHVANVANGHGLLEEILTYGN